MRPFTALAVLAVATSAEACGSCRPEVRAAVLSSEFVPTLLKLVLPMVAVVAVLPRIAGWLDRR